MGRLGWIWQPSHAPQMFCNTKNRATLGAVHQNCASPPISLSVPWDPGPALSRVVWQLLEPSTIASYADKEGESQGWCKEQLCALLFTGPGAEAWRADGQCITIGVRRYETCWLPTAFEIKLGKTMFSVGRGARRWMSHIFPFRQPSQCDQNGTVPGHSVCRQSAQALNHTVLHRRIWFFIVLWTLRAIIWNTKQCSTSLPPPLLINT